MGFKERTVADTRYLRQAQVNTSSEVATLQITLLTLYYNLTPVSLSLKSEDTILQPLPGTRHLIYLSLPTTLDTPCLLCVG